MPCVFMISFVHRLAYILYVVTLQDILITAIVILNTPG